MDCRCCKWKVAVCAPFASCLSSFGPIFVAGVVAAGIATAPALATEVRPKWSGYFDVLGFPGADGTLQRTDLFIPLLQGEAALSYLNLRNELDDDGFAGFSAGLGMRYQLRDWIIGTYGFVDWRETDHSGEYVQYSGGIELLSETWDLRFNGYLPDEQTSRIVDVGAVDADPEKDQIFYLLTAGQRNLPGYDAEIGTRLGQWDNLDWNEAAFLAPESMQVWAHVGGYVYIGDEGFDDVTGVRGRLEVGFDDLAFAGRGSRLTLGVEARYDDVHEEEFAARLRLRIPFGVFSGGGDGGGGEDGGDLADSNAASDLSLDPLDRRMTASVMRWPAEVLGEDRETAPTYNPGGQAYNRYLEAGSPEQLAALLEGRKSEDEVLFINMRGEAGDWDLTDFETAGNGITYAVAGKAAPVFYDDPYGGGRLRFDYTPKGATPRLLFDEATAASTDKTFVFKPGDHLNGWEIDAMGYEHGIHIADAGVYYITNSDISGASKRGVHAVGSGVADLHLHIWDSKLHHNKDGLQVGLGAQVIAADSHFDSNQAKGVVVGGVESWFKMIGGSVSHNAGNGVGVSGYGSIDLDGVTISHNTNGIGMYKPGSADDNDPKKGVKIINSEISFNSDDGIANFYDLEVVHGVLINNNFIHDNTSHGMELRPLSGEISGNHIYNNGANAIQFAFLPIEGEVQTIILTYNHVYENEGAGIFFNIHSGSTVDVNISHNEIYKNRLTGLVLDRPGGKLVKNIIRENGYHGIDFGSQDARDGFELIDNVIEGNVRGDCNDTYLCH